MTTNITITKPQQPPATPMRRTLPGWIWFIALWCVGVGGAMSLGFAFKILMNLTLFAVK
ncbi:hypothetical protein P3T40_003362 [Paraburkholderia sp. EB58]|jgi:hypothetical protein|uniref:hypothetical protein n=1 Tax=Paraburkholderia sp. EB58 TaxID=3035125 RepID=UPI003D24EBD7